MRARSPPTAAPIPLRHPAGPNKRPGNLPGREGPPTGRLGQRGTRVMTQFGQSLVAVPTGRLPKLSQVVGEALPGPRRRIERAFRSWHLCSPPPCGAQHTPLASPASEIDHARVDNRRITTPMSRLGAARCPVLIVPFIPVLLE